jgi:predicted RNA-binding protein with TRAM domain
MPGMYYTSGDYHGVPGKTYTLTIRDLDIDGDGVMEEYSASSELNPVNPIDSITLRYFDAFGFTGYEVQIYAWDSPEKDWYSFKVHKNGVLLTDTLTELIVQNDDFFNGNYTYGITSQFLSNDKEEEVVEVGDTITFEINGITEDYYNYVIEAQTEVFESSPLFSGPPANIRTNLNNDAIGFFSAYSVNYSSTIATADVVNGGISE